MNAPLHREMPAGTLDSHQALSHVTQAWDSSFGEGYNQLDRLHAQRVVAVLGDLAQPSVERGHEPIAIDEKLSP